MSEKHMLRNKSERQCFLNQILGKPINVLPSSKLPTKKTVLLRFLGKQQEYNLDNKRNISRRCIAADIVSEIDNLWEKAALPFIRKDHQITSVFKLVDEYDSKLKNISRFMKEPSKLELYIQTLDQLFDIAPSKIYEILKSTSKRNSNWADDFKFYENQKRVPQVGSIGGRDAILEKRVNDIKKRECEELARKEKLTGQNFISTVNIYDSDDDVSKQKVDEDEADEEYTPKRQKLVKEKNNLIEATTPVAARYGLSATAHCAMVASTAKALQPNVDIEVPGISTTKRKRTRCLEAKAQDIKESFSTKLAGYPKVVQWDGKIMTVENKEGRVKQDINAIVISVPGTSLSPTTIGASSLETGTGANLASSTLSKISEWTPPDDIFAAVFDTTSSNTGVREGAMMHLEVSLDKKLLWLPCRHHIAELHIKHVWLQFFPSKSPDDPFFKSFKEWFLTNKNNISPETFRTYEWADEDKDCENGPFLKQENHFINQTRVWLQSHLEANTFPRDDYRELCELMNFILGGKVGCHDISKLYKIFVISFNTCFFAMHLLE